MASRAPKSSYAGEPRKSNLELATTANPNSFLGKIVKAVNAVAVQLQALNPDAKHNTGRFIGEAYLWDEISKYAEARSKALWEQLETDGVIKSEKLDPGGHALTESPRFIVSAEVTVPVRRFDPNVFANWLEKYKKVPVIVTKEQLELAKVPTKSQVKMKIIER